jgi:16S rRNA (cytosine1402-N4)-methyltransferase
MSNTPYQHTPVMAKEVIEYLKPDKGKVFVDCTLGGGGHAEAILKALTPLSPSPSGRGGEKGVRVIAFDQDLEAIEAARQKLAEYSNIEYIRDNFSNIKKHVKEKVDGFLFDLGVSSYQIDEAPRGFSFQKDGPLDMRMDRGQKLTANEIVNRFPAGEIERIIRDYGEERFARRIARAIVEKRPLNATFELKEIVEKAIPTWRKRESVSRVFQALRIAVNSELENLQKALKDSVELLRPGGRIVVISYHSLEDRIVKHAFRGFALTKKPVLPSAEEIASNPRAKSAKLRAAEKT